MEYVAAGTFDVTMKPSPAPTDAPADAPGSTLGQASLDKTYEGDLVATAAGTMLTAMTATKRSAAYVAIERVTGSLHGREGSFVLQHAGTMDRGAQSLVVGVVPDSGTDQLAGLNGALQITIENGTHFYSFAYSLPE